MLRIDVVIAAGLGFNVGGLPDGIAWSAVKLAFAVCLFIAAVRAARRTVA